MLGNHHRCIVDGYRNFSRCLTVDKRTSPGQTLTARMVSYRACNNSPCLSCVINGSIEQETQICRLLLIKQQIVAHRYCQRMMCYHLGSFERVPNDNSAIQRDYQIHFSASENKWSCVVCGKPSDS